MKKWINSFLTKGKTNVLANNEQLMFDAVAEAVSTQEAPRDKNKPGRPAYRSPDGRQCFIGYLIPDENYYEDLEGKDADDSRVLAAIDEKYNVGYMNGDFLMALQRIHDHTYAVWWPYELRKLAEKSKLTIPDSIKAT